MTWIGSDSITHKAGLAPQRESGCTRFLACTQTLSRTSTCTSSGCRNRPTPRCRSCWRIRQRARSEEHTSELQSRLHLVCRLLLEKKKNKRFFLLYFIIKISGTFDQ